MRISLAVALVSSLTIGAAAARQQSPCNQPLPAGFRLLDLVFWDGPWFFAPGASAPTPLPTLDNPSGQLVNGPIRVRFDDGRDGTLRIESRPCGPSDDCTPFDCGCPLKEESYWISVADARGRSVARLHLWAAYGRFQVVPADLVDGAGDELVIVRVPAHASPPIGYDLKIWKFDATKPVELGGGERVAGLLSTRPIGCARWRTFLSIDPAGPKPRSIALRTEFAATPCCLIDAPETDRVADLLRGQVLHFDPERQRYVGR